MTTAAAAKHLGRNYIMIERDAKYCAYGSERLKKIDFVDNDIAKATFDIKPIRVSIAEMIDAGALIVDEDFYFKDGKPIAKLCQNGYLNYNGEIIDMHSCAAKARGVKAERLNGFEYWYVIRNEILTSISKVREDFRKTKV